MIWADIVWGAPSWIVVAVLLAIIGCGLVAWSYRVQGGDRLDLWRVGCMVGKIVAVVALAVCLAEPRYVGQTGPRPGAKRPSWLRPDNSPQPAAHRNVTDSAAAICCQPVCPRPRRFG
jgi:hypothetical protein